MDNPVEEISAVIYKLTTGSPRLQQQTLEHYFTPNASFSHPFCAVNANRNHILSIFRWYKILSPKIEIQVNGISYEEARQKLYVDISQTFRIWPFIPLGYRANVNLVTVLQLTRDPSGLDPSGERNSTSSSTSGPFTDSGIEKPAPTLAAPSKYWIKSQTDLYQITECTKFISLLGLLSLFVAFWQYAATYACVLGAVIFAPFTALMQRYSDDQVEHRARVQTDSAFGPGGRGGGMTLESRERQKQLDVWEAEARFLGGVVGGIAEGDVGKMKMEMKMEQSKHNGVGEGGKDEVLDFMKMEKGRQLGP